MTKRKKPEDKQKAGADSAFREEFCAQVTNLCLLMPGITDEQIADFYGKAPSTIAKWKADYPEFSEAIKAGKTPADCNVVGQLYQRCMGQEVVETQPIKLKRVEYHPETGKKLKEWEDVAEVEVRRYIPPSDPAIFFYLHNRRRGEWLRGSTHGGDEKPPSPPQGAIEDSGRDHLIHLAARFGVTPAPLSNGTGNGGDHSGDEG